LKPHVPFVFGLVALLSPLTATADCGLIYQVCEKVCKVKHLTDDPANAGCVSKCVAERGVCMAKVGARKTAEAGEQAWTSTKSFFKGLSGD
jgi:hypothetical protein